ncbi:Hypothetical_protein [Hexamita inflata]|uniref:Hypothetical_protein n=1 Tax=Hexamita inflata TaxID=28002 RepID=A0AA86PEQ8_9EUKA|nr:Hypothetical protein HINF_LOCUS24868 [Hexamita inflata]
MEISPLSQVRKLLQQKREEQQETVQQPQISTAKSQNQAILQSFLPKELSKVSQVVAVPISRQSKQEKMDELLAKLALQKQRKLDMSKSVAEPAKEPVSIPEPREQPVQQIHLSPQQQYLDEADDYHFIDDKAQLDIVDVSSSYPVEPKPEQNLIKMNQGVLFSNRVQSSQISQNEQTTQFLQNRLQQPTKQLEYQNNNYQQTFDSVDEELDPEAIRHEMLKGFRNNLIIKKVKDNQQIEVKSENETNQITQNRIQTNNQNSIWSEKKSLNESQKLIQEQYKIKQEAVQERAQNQNQINLEQNKPIVRSKLINKLHKQSPVALLGSKELNSFDSQPESFIQPLHYQDNQRQPQQFNQQQFNEQQYQKEQNENRQYQENNNQYNPYQIQNQNELNPPQSSYLQSQIYNSQVRDESVNTEYVQTNFKQKFNKLIMFPPPTQVRKSMLLLRTKHEEAEPQNNNQNTIFFVNQTIKTHPLRAVTPIQKVKITTREIQQEDVLRVKTPQRNTGKFKLQTQLRVSPPKQPAELKPTVQETYVTRAKSNNRLIQIMNKRQQ